MSAAAALLDQLGRPGDIRLGTAHGIAPLRRLPSGLVALDGVLGGGLPRGRVTELMGPRGAGRTGLATAVAACATRAGETIAWVDPEDALDPDTAEAAGVALARTLWVRPRGLTAALGAADILLGAGGFGLVILDLGERSTQPSRTWPRLAHAAERTGAVLLVLTPRSQVGTFAALGLEVTGRRVRWSGGPGRSTLLAGIDTRLRVARSRIGRSEGELVVREACA